MALANRIVVRSSSDNHVLFKVFRAVYNTAGDEIRPYFEHRHSELEISVIASGSGIYTCSGVDYDFSSGDVFLHCGNDEHFMKYIACLPIRSPPDMDPRRGVVRYQISADIHRKQHEQPSHAEYGT